MLLQMLLFVPFCLVTSSTITAAYALSTSSLALVRQQAYVQSSAVTTRGRGSMLSSNDEKLNLRHLRYYEHERFNLGKLGATDERAATADEMMPSKQYIPRFVYIMNSSTKWLVTLAHTISVWSRPKSFLGPFIVVGSIGAVYLTDVLKKIINQDRPAGTPFTDPGMPSSHSLVSFFAAAAWMTVVGNSNSHVLGGIGGMVLLSSAATTVAVLRVICGYHSIAQIVVGGVIGSILGQLWFHFGQAMNGVNSQLAYSVSWGSYIAGSAFFIAKNMRHWLSKDAYI